MASQNVARLGVILGIDTAKWEADINDAIAANRKLKTEITKDSRAAEKEIERLTWAIKDYGREVSNAEKMEREFLVGGKFANASAIRQAELRKLAKSYDEVVASQRKAAGEQMGMLGRQGAAGQLNPQQLAALSYQTTDIVTGLVGGQNPLLVLIQQGGQLRDQFGGVTNVFKAFATVLTPMRLAIGGVTAVLGTLGFLAYKGSEQFKEFRNAIILTNNAAGINLDSFRRLSTELSDRLNVSLSSSKDIFLELVRSGKFTADSMGPVAEVIARIAKLSGESADVVAKNLIPSFNGSKESAKSLNEQYNFLTFAQYQQIEALDLAGRRQESAKLTADLLNQSLNNQSKELQQNEGLWQNLTRTVSNFMDAIKQIGMPETDEEKLLRLARTYEDVIRRAESEGLDAVVIEAALDNYFNFYKEMVKKREKLEADALRQRTENERIATYNSVGGEQRRQDILASTRKIYADREFQERVAGADQFLRVQLEAEKKKELAAYEFARQLQINKGLFREELEQEAIAKINAAELEANQKILEISRQAAEELRKEQQNRTDALATEKEKLEIYERNLFISKTDYQITLNKLRAEQEIAKIEANKALTPQAKQEAINREREIQARADGVARLEERLEHLRSVNAAVFKSMEQAVEQFVRTGKFSFKDFAASAVRSILEIYAKQQLLQMFNIGKSFFGFGSQSPAPISDISIPFGTAADGGYISGPTVVGEHGPELFIPRTAGTVVPNQQMSNFQPQPQIVYNGPYIAQMSAIDTQSATQFLAQNKEAVYAANLSAGRSVPTSR